MNPNRAKLIQMTRQHQQECRLESRRPATMFIPPKRREVATLVDWIADHPAAKSSRALRQAQDALLESLGIY
jgi:hypothetical protein